MRRLHLIVSNVALILLDNVGIHRIDHQCVDYDIEVHFSSGKVFLQCQRLSSSFPL